MVTGFVAAANLFQAAPGRYEQRPRADKQLWKDSGTEVIRQADWTDKASARPRDFFLNAETLETAVIDALRGAEM
jgi:hypothetical protein